jgi:type I restriction enzyme S subunit
MRLGDLVEIRKGKKPASITAEPSVGCRRLIQIDDLRPGASPKYCPEAADEVAALETDVLIAWDGANAGTSSFGLSGVIGSTLAMLRPVTSTVFTPYLGHFVRANEGHLRSRCKGATVPHIDSQVLQTLDMPLPPLDEQRRIAEILDKADALRAKRRAALARLDTLTQAIFLEMFGDPIANGKQWPNPTVGGALAFQQYGPRFYNESYSEEGVRIVRITDLSETGSLDFGSMPRIKVSEADREKYLLRPGDLIFARTGATVGKIALIEADSPPCIAGAYFITMRFRPSVHPVYARAVLSSRSVREIVVKRSRQAAQQNFSGPGLRRLPMPCPPMSLQREFAHRIDAIKQLRTAALAGLGESEGLFSCLQQRAFNAK